MARLALLRALTIAGAALVLALPAGAETLQRLTVTQLTLGADTTAPAAETPFHLIVTARVRERITELDNVDLPILAELELLGDEHTLVAGANGTTYRETITVVAHHTGAITIAPVTLDAIDARDGKAKRYFSNSLTLHVRGVALAPERAVSDAAAALRRTLLIAVAAFLVVLVLLRLRRRRPAVTPRPVPMVTVPPPIPVVRDPRERAREWLAQLRAHPDRAGALHVRASARRAVGATEAETLSDALRRPLAQDPSMRRLLQALERAGFTYDADVPAAVDAVLHHLEAMAS